MKLDILPFIIQRPAHEQNFQTSCWINQFPALAFLCMETVILGACAFNMQTRFTTDWSWFFKQFSYASCGQFFLCPKFCNESAQLLLEKLSSKLDLVEAGPDVVYKF